jgi:hypothetical protein
MQSGRSAASGDTASAASGDTASAASGDTASAASGDTASAASGDTASAASGDTAGAASGGASRHPESVPAWLRETAGEWRIPVVVAIVAAIVLQAMLPSAYRLGPRFLVPGLEALLLAVLVVANPVRFDRETRTLRTLSLILTALVSLANATSAVLLIKTLIVGRNGAADNAAALLAGGAAIFVTNIIAFGLWYWEFDRGGPFARAAARRRHGDFLFPQMANPEVTDLDWEPQFLDYLYVSFTNAVAFSPTDTMPLSRWAKMLMLAQSATSVATLGLVIARAVNVLR